MLVFSMMCYKQQLIFFVGKEDSIQVVHGSVVVDKGKDMAFS
jgi:hypothetical protein